MKEKIKEKSLAWEILEDKKRDNKRLFIIWVITFLALVTITIFYIRLNNDLGTIETTEVTQENKDGYNNYIGNDGDINNGETKNKEN